MKPGLIALLGLLLTLAALIADVLLLNVATIRNGYWTFLPLGVGLALEVAATVRRRAWTTWVPAFVVVLLVGAYTVTRFLSAPSAPPAIGVGETFPDVVLKDQDNRPVRIHESAEQGPRVVVLFRGSW